LGNTSLPDGKSCAPEHESKLLTNHLAFGLDQDPPKHEVKRRAVEFIAEMLSSPEHEIKRLTSSGVGYFC